MTIEGIIKDIRKNYTSKKDVNKALQSIINDLANDEASLFILKEQARQICKEHSFFYFFTQFSFLEESSFIAGIWNRLKRKVLPIVLPEKDIIYYLHRVLDLQVDQKWVQELDANLLSDLFVLLDLTNDDIQGIKRDLVWSIKALSLRISSFGVDHRVKSKFDTLGIDYKDFYAFQELVNNVDDTNNGEAILEKFKVVDQNIKSLRARKNEIGTSLKLTYSTRRITHHIDRLRDLLSLSLGKDSKLVAKDIFLKNMNYHVQKNSIWKYVSDHTDLLTLEIVEHSARKGGYYIAENKREYFKVFKSSLLGGLFIALFAFVKIYLDTIEMDSFWQSVLFSINYSLCFIFVKVVGGTIATKQPAMTASALCKGIDADDDLSVDSIKDVILTIQRVSSSQFVSFLGNLLMAFPLAWLISVFFGQFFEIDIVSTEKAVKLLKDINPQYSNVILFSAVAGVYLALTGLVSGYFDNRVISSNLSKRIAYQPLLNKLFSRDKLHKLSNSISKNVGAYSGNIFLGFCLGMTAYFGNKIGIPLDIRHIAFSSANFGYALSFVPVNMVMILWIIFGIYLIGLINFLVSFGITFYISLRSRNVRISQWGKILKQLVRVIAGRPWSLLVFPTNFNAGKHEA